ncbi:MAG: hypothetical protein PHD84_10415 [Atribacterota bacterium]|nr:hypothetical protein [Atribacterota bacterium]
MVLFLITNHIFGWTIPTEDPPGGNITPSFSQWTTSGSNIYYNAGNVGIGTTNPGAKLEIAGQLKMTGGTPGVDKVLISDASGLASWGTVDGGACVLSGNDIICSGIPTGSNGSLSITYNGVTCPIWKDCDGDGKTYGNGDCDESCSTCYVGSTSYTTSPDDKDQDCDGVLNNGDFAEYYLFTTTETYTGYLGYRSGADSKCNSAASKPADCSGNAYAFIGTSASYEIRDMPSFRSIRTDLAWKFKQGSSTAVAAANNWADLLDGSVSNTPSSGGLSTGYWTFSSSNGAWISASSCAGAGTSSESSNGEYGSNNVTTSGWLQSSTATCNTYHPIICFCAGPISVYR